jgi:hypothetical protein
MSKFSSEGGMDRVGRDNVVISGRGVCNEGAIVEVGLETELAGGMLFESLTGGVVLTSRFSSEGGD